MNSIQGIGWVDEQAFGTVRQGERTDYTERATTANLWKHFPLFESPIRNFGRFDTLARMTCYACALALRDAGIAYGEGRNLDMGIIATDSHGCAKANEVYFRDYVEGGRKLARANLFIYTLSSSSIAEAAIHFRLQGPTVYMTRRNAALSHVLWCAGRYVSSGESAAMSVIHADEKGVISFIVAAGGPESGICHLEDAVAITRESGSVSDIAEAFENLVEKGR